MITTITAAAIPATVPRSTAVGTRRSPGRRTPRPGSACGGWAIDERPDPDGHGARISARMIHSSAILGQPMATMINPVTSSRP